jgi:CheY-like chemotaxis protein
MTHILVIEDGAVIRGLMNEILCEAGYSVRTAATAQETAVFEFPPRRNGAESSEIAG